MNPKPTPDEAPRSETLPESATRRSFPGLFGCLFVGFTLIALVGLAWPTTGGIQIKGAQTKAVAQAKQVGLALKIFATDHDGNYPRQGIPKEMVNAPTDSNTAFACLFPMYIQSETIFGNKLSVYQTSQPDNVIENPYTGRPKETLQPGENVYSYVMGLNEGDNPAAPLVVDGTDGTGHYRSDRRQRGGVWEGKKAVVIRLDNSGTLENLAGPADARYIPGRPDATPTATAVPATSNLLDFSHFGRPVTLLDPATGPRRR